MQVVLRSDALTPALSLKGEEVARAGIILWRYLDP
jgi:hypothetical protein